MSDPAPTEYGTQRGRLTGGERRVTILRAARQEFARAGYHGASTAAIARTAGCSEPMLYKHFAGKLDLFIAVLTLVSSTIEDSFDTALEAPGDLLENLQELLPRIMCDPVYVEMLQLRKLAITIVDDPVIHALLAEQQARHTARVTAAVGRARRAGQVREDVEPVHVAWAWTGFMLAGCYRESLEPGGFARMLPLVQAYIASLVPEPETEPEPETATPDA